VRPGPGVLPEVGIPTPELETEEISHDEFAADVSDDLLDPNNPHHAQWVKDHPGMGSDAEWVAEHPRTNLRKFRVAAWNQYTCEPVTVHEMPCFFDGLCHHSTNARFNRQRSSRMSAEAK